jgi:hypothetical protein
MTLYVTPLMQRLDPQLTILTMPLMTLLSVPLMQRKAQLILLSVYAPGAATGPSWSKFLVVYNPAAWSPGVISTTYPHGQGKLITVGGLGVCVCG